MATKLTDDQAQKMGLTVLDDDNSYAYLLVPTFRSVTPTEANEFVTRRYAPDPETTLPEVITYAVERVADDHIIVRKTIPNQVPF